MEGNLPDIEDIAFRLRMDTTAVARAIIELEGFLIIDDISVISERYHLDDPETETETETETEKAMSYDSPQSPPEVIEEKQPDMSDDDLEEIRGTVIHFDMTPQTIKPEPKSPGKSVPVKMDYPDEFEEVWGIYPKRGGDNPKKRAFRAWNARRKEGHSEAELYDGTVRYAAYCSDTGKIGTEVVKMAATFFGPDKSFLEAWDLPNPPPRPGARPERFTVPRDKDAMMPWAEKYGYPKPGSQTYDQYRRTLELEADRRMNQEESER